MATFRFRLAPLVRLRELARDQRRRELAEVQAIEQSLAEQTAEIVRQIDDNRRLMTVDAGPVDVDRALGAQRFEMVLRMNEQTLRQQQAAVAAEVEHRRAALVEADREVKILEKLREQQQARFEAEQFHRENKFLDEVATRGATRKEMA